MERCHGIFRKLNFLVLLSGLAALVTLWGCGSNSYDTPKTTDTAPVAGDASSVLIEPASLKVWMDQGLLNTDGHFDKNVVILDFGGYTLDPDTDPLRIAGACRVAKAELEKLRFEGVGDANPLAATGEQMDAVLQRLGINANTTIVFTTSSSSYYATRAYWTFRYWGFDKSRLKLLNGGNAAFETAYPELMTKEAPAPVASTYSVRELPALNPDLRASVGEMIEIVKTLPESTTDLVIDARGSKNYSGLGSTPGLVTGGVVVVDGHPEGGQYLSQADLYTDGKFKTRNEIETLFADKGWSLDKKTTVYCTSGYSATPLFFALDAILDAPTQLFDGSWSELGRYSGYAAAGGQLPVNSPWAIDSYLDPATRSYNGFLPDPLLIESLQADATAEANDPFIGNDPTSASDVNPLANQVEVEDAAAVGATPTVTISNPVATATLGVLIDTVTLKGWMNAGLVNAAQGAERVVLLDVTSASSYAAGHIPGAQLWDTSGQAVTRLEGPAPAVNMVIPAETMNARLQALGIDENTTIVLTSSQTASYYPSRAYFTLRYYGWPKSRLKVLNGYNGVWDQNDLTTEATDLADSTLTVQAIGDLQPDLRVSLPELMDAVRDGRGIAVDMRGDKSAAGSTAGVFSDVSGDYVVFEGTIKGGTYFAYTGFQVDPSNGDLRYKSAAEIRAALAAIGLNGSELAYSYCRTAYIASVGFFVLDGILDWPVMIYDGSWSQWGKLSADSTKGGELTNTAWAVDNATYMEVVNYNADHTKQVEPLNPDPAALSLLPSDPAANQVETTDQEYQATPVAGDSDTGTAPTAGTGTDGGC